MLRIAVVFPGQGVQGPGLGDPWVGSPAWRALEAEGILDDESARLLTRAAGPELEATDAAQRTVLLASLLAWITLRDRLGRRGEPVVFAGHSLGQCTALIAAGVLPVAAGVHWATRRAAHTRRAAERHPGGLLALLGADPATAARVCSEVPGACWIAIDNAPGQVVLGARAAALPAVAAAARAAGVRRTVPLPVAGAFHTPLMADAVAGFRDDVAIAPFSAPRTPVLSNLDAAAPTDPDTWRAHALAHLVEPVRWRATQEAIAARRPDLLVEVGPGTTLSTLAKRAIPQVPRVAVAGPESIERLVASLPDP